MHGGRGWSYEGHGDEGGCPKGDEGAGLEGRYRVRRVFRSEAGGHDASSSDVCGRRAGGDGSPSRRRGGFAHSRISAMQVDSHLLDVGAARCRVRGRIGQGGCLVSQTCAVVGAVLSKSRFRFGAGLIFMNCCRCAAATNFFAKSKKSLAQPEFFGILITAVTDSEHSGWVAQLVEQRTENPRVRGSIPFPATL